MATMAYKAKGANGKIIRGKIEANSAQDALSRLRRSGVQVLSLDKSSRASGGAGQSAKGAGRKRIKMRELLWTLSQLQLMVKAGTSLDDALKITSDSTENLKMKEVLEDLQNRVKKGQSFSEALGSHPEVFHPIVSRIVAAGEASGMLPKMLGTVHDLLERSHETRRTIISAMLYPLILLSVAGVALGVLFLWVLPKFVKVFNEVGAELPGITVAVLAVSEFVVKYKLILLILFVGMGIAFWRLRKNTDVVCRVTRFMLGMPVFGPLIRAANTTRAMELMGTLWRAGLPITEVTRLTGATMGNPLYEAFFKDLRQQLVDGKRLTSVFMGSELFPKSVAPLIRTGETTGNTPEVMKSLADFHDKETRGHIKTMITLLEPAIIVVMAGAVGVIALSVVLPLFRLSSAVN